MKPTTADSIKNDLDLSMHLLGIGISSVCDSQYATEAVIMRSTRLILHNLYTHVEAWKEKGVSDE